MGVRGFKPPLLITDPKFQNIADKYLLDNYINIKLLKTIIPPKICHLAMSEHPEIIKSTNNAKILRAQASEQQIGSKNRTR